MTWRESSQIRTYLHPYQDQWGALHVPTCEWDELLKNYRAWTRLIPVSEGSRRMCTPMGDISATRIVTKLRTAHEVVAMPPGRSMRPTGKEESRRFYYRRKRAAHRSQEADSMARRDRITVSMVGHEIEAEMSELVSVRAVATNGDRTSGVG